MGTPSRPLPTPPRPSPAGRPPKERGKGCVLGSFVGCLVVIFAIIVGLIGLWRTGKSSWEDEVAEALRDDEAVVKHLGTLQEAEIDFGHTMAIEGEDRFAFRLTGTRGTGLARLEIDDAEGVRIVSGTLQLEDGSTVDLLAGQGEEEEAEEETEATPPPRRERDSPAGRVRTTGGWVEADTFAGEEPEAPEPDVEETAGESAGEPAAGEGEGEPSEESAPPSEEGEY